ncbi:ATP-binding cassette domain-containing protein [Nonomuraea sp. ATR24]|uniref:ATP-binding cassette domain-containing protein n=1 Tax=Nonomuraea sp. ATR24 TaxID=1676744 RepID=UPI0035BFE312
MSVTADPAPAPAVSPSLDVIRITGAREHNLKDVSLTIPKNQITVFTGVSGSGKSSIVFDTVAVEAQRQLNGTYPWFIRNQLPKYERPLADAIENLTPPVVVDQKPLGGNARSTVGTITDIYSVIRSLFARYGTPTDGLASTYSFNNPRGMCTGCDGLGRSVRADVDLMLDRDKSLADGAILVPGYGVGTPDWQLYANSGKLDPAKPVRDYTQEEMDFFLHGTGGKVQLTTKSGSYKTNYEGLLDRFTRLGVKRDMSKTSERTRETIQRFISEGGAGAHGGEIVYTGSFAGLREADTPTGRGLRAATTMKTEFRQPRGVLPITGATLHNLKDVSVDIPLGVLTVVTGVAGSGKSTLIADVFTRAYPEAVYVDQSPIAASARSTPATYLGLMDPIRKLFAQASGQPASLFSFNSEGACAECQGRGVIITELAYMDPVTVRCTACDGSRFHQDVLAHRLDGRSIADVLALPAEQAVDAFTQPALRRKLRALTDVGLDYLTLGQPLSTLSGGELQRIKLAAQLHRTGTVYVLDEPTTGLHMSDITTLLTLLDTLVRQGDTVVAIEHNLDVVQQADHVIDLGPDGGKDGGRIVFTGTPLELLQSPDSLTGEHLRRYRSTHAHL